MSDWILIPSFLPLKQQATEAPSQQGSIQGTVVLVLFCPLSTHRVDL